MCYKTRVGAKAALMGKEHSLDVERSNYHALDRHLDEIFSNAETCVVYFKLEDSSCFPARTNYVYGKKTTIRSKSTTLFWRRYSYIR